MGELVMKDLFNKENFLFPGFDKKQRLQSLIVFGLLAILFIFSAFTFVNMLFAFTDAAGSIVSGSIDVALKGLYRSVPLFLSFFMTFWSLLLVHAFFRNVSEKKRMRSLKKNSIAVIAFAGICILFVLIGLITGEYSSIVEGSPSPLFPLDAVLYSIVFLALGLLVLIRGRKFLEKHPYVVPSRGPIVTRARFVYCFFVAIWSLFAVYSFATFFFGLFIIDFIHGYLAFSIALLLVYLLNACFLMAWEFYYNEVKAEKKKDVLLPLAIVGLVISVAIAIFYFVALGLNLDGPSNVGFGVLPIAFAASANIATILTIATPIIVSVTALIKGAVMRKRK